MKNGVLSFDLDLTLLEHANMRITPSALDAINLLRDQWYIVIASGRDMNDKNVSHFKDLIRPDGIVHANGARVEFGGQIIAEWPIPAQTIEDLLAVAKKENWCVGTWDGKYAYFVNEESMVKYDIEWRGKCDRLFRPVEEILTWKLYTMTIRGSEENIKKAEKLFPQLAFPRFGGIPGADIVLKQAGKKNGMKILLDHIGLNFNDVIAFGDSKNDLELLTAAKIGIAMGNSELVVKEQADYVTDDIDQDGVWNACKHFGLISD